MEKTRREIAVEARRGLMGEEAADKSAAAYNDFNREFYEEITLLNVWGRSWSRGILAHRELSLINIAMLTALRQWDEFEIHFRLALTRTNVPIEALRELLIHISVYCGVPAAHTAFGIAERLMRENGMDPATLKIRPADEIAQLNRQSR